MSDLPAPLPNTTHLAHPARARRWLLWTIVFLVVLAAAGIGGRQLATQKLKEAIQQALGPNSEVSSIEVGLSAVTITGIHIRAEKGWPAAEELSARQVVVRPDWGALMSRNIRIASIEIEDGYLSMLRRKDGKLVLLPSLLGKASPEPAGKAKGSTETTKNSEATMPEIHVGAVELRNAAVDFYDASVRQPPHKLRLEQTTVKVGQVNLPALNGQTSLALDGVVKGVQRDGKVSIKGWMELASKDSEIQTQLAGVDLVAFQPYLIKAAETGVKKGSMDLDLKSTVKKNRLHAPGKVTLTGLELSTGKTFMGMPREAVVGMMKDKNGRITAEFVLEGNIDDPKFSINDKFLTQVGGATAKFLGISLEGLATGIGTAGGAAAQGIGSAVGKLFGSGERK
ncbi:MAG: hypothetical protein QG584_1340 [Pseudomonadota bacterium]|nr:hypothetical protein [Pseudomonadota bacterium]